MVDNLEQGTIETWMLLEYADRGSLEQAIQARRFYKRIDASLDLVSRVFLLNLTWLAGRSGSGVMAST